MARLTTAQAADRLGVNPSRVRQLILDGKLPAVKFGKAWAIDERHLGRVADRKTGRPRKG